jgi:predicted permease
MGNFSSEVRQALRSLRRTPAFTLAAVFTLVLAIGATTAVYSAADAVLIRPLGAGSTARLVGIEANMPALAVEHMPLAPAEVADLNARHDLFTNVAAYRAGPMNLTSPSEPRRVASIATFGPIFSVLGFHPYLGRFYDSSDVARGDTHVAVLTYEFWQSLTGGDEKVLGRALHLDGSDYRVIGVLPPAVDFPRGTQLWTPQPPFPGFDDPNNRCCKYLTTLARVRNDVTDAHLAAALAAQQIAWQDRYPRIYSSQGNGGEKIHQQTLTMIGIAESLAGPLRPILLLLIGATGFVLLIACANVASLQLVRTALRAREIAVRSALGASRGRIARQVGLEAALIAGVSGGLGIALGGALLGVVRHVGAESVPALEHVSLNLGVLAVTAFTTLGVAIAFALVPARRATSIDPATTLGSSMRGASMGVVRGRLLRSTVILEVSLSLALLLGGLVALRSLDRLVLVNPGFDPHGVIRMRLALPPSRYPSKSAKVTFSAELLDRLRAVPGVASVGTVSGSPFGYLRNDEHSTVVQAGRKGAPVGSDARASIWIVDGDYFEAMGIPIRRGRGFSDADDSTATPVWLADETLSHKLFGSADPVGRQMTWPATIIGEVGAVKKSDLSGPDEPSVYWSFRQYPGTDISVVVRSALPLATLEPSLRAAVRAIDSRIPVFDVTTMRDAVSRSLGPRRLASTVLGMFALLALTLALGGIFGVLSYMTSQREKEIGIRIALGATSFDVVHLITWDGARLAMIGVSLGTIVYVAVARVLGSIVYGISERDPLMIAAAATFVLVVAGGASWLPAWRASRVDPLEALRAE